MSTLTKDKLGRIAKDLIDTCKVAGVENMFIFIGVNKELDTDVNEKFD